jgi:hypothetical protein
MGLETAPRSTKLFEARAFVVTFSVHGHNTVANPFHTKSMGQQKTSNRLLLCLAFLTRSLLSLKGMLIEKRGAKSNFSFLKKIVTLIILYPLPRGSLPKNFVTRQIVINMHNTHLLVHNIYSS